MQTTMLAISLIKEFEGYVPEAYIDPVGVPTIGYGTTRWSDGERVQLGDTIGHDEAESELFKHVRKEVEPTLSKHFSEANLQPNQRDALASFVYNLGPDVEGKYATLHRLVLAAAPADIIARQLVKYRNKGSAAEKGLYRRRVAEALMWAGLPWERAQSVEMEDDVVDVLNEVRAEHDLFEPEEASDALAENYEDMTPNEKTEYLNERELEKLGGEVEAIPAPPSAKPAAVKVLPPVEVVELNDVPYISNPTPGSKKVAHSRRGRGFAKQEVAKHAGFVAAGGWAAESVGAVEPTVKFVEKYSSATIAWVFLAIGVFAVGYYFFGKWQQQLGEDEAEDHLH